MPRKCKDCPICGKRSLKRLANHLANVHELSSEERQPYLIRAKPTALDLENVLGELYRLIWNSKKQSKRNKEYTHPSTKILQEENKIKYKALRGQYRNGWWLKEAVKVRNKNGIKLLSG
jgi:methylthioribose-1-phosphate isomerase